ncbi:hypothetical protein HDU85_000094 [Gaertneriomyces sp. JEL0708]|nr:hypothetical protein HDU85_000094 [Gaertneriomyces sp. JEL0708]
MSSSSGRPNTASSDWPNVGSDRYFGLENFGNTCYCNSVVQALYFCRPFRECLQEYAYPISAALMTAAQENLSLPSPSPSPVLKPISSASSLNGYFKTDVLKEAKAVSTDKEGARTEKKRRETLKSAGGSKATAITTPPLMTNILEGFEGAEQNQDTLLSALRELFLKIASQKKRTGVVAPQQFVTILKKENELFRSTMHQDAHEMLNYLLNAIAEILVRHRTELGEKLRSMSNAQPGGNPNESLREALLSDSRAPASWVHALFEGVLTNETKCLTCETVTSRDEAFLDLSVDVEPNCSLSSCLRNFSREETLRQKNKYFCDHCRSLQEAQKRMKIKRTPNILAVHLKRFKYQERLQRYVKLSYRVPFPLELRLFNTADGAADPDRLYQLFAVIVHIGTGPHHGHYVTLVKSHDKWLLCDDDDVTPVDESELQKYYGDPSSVGCGYIFFYAADDFDAQDLVRSMRPYEGGSVSSTTGSGEPSSSAAASDGSALANPPDAKPPSVSTASPVMPTKKAKMGKRPSVSGLISEAQGKEVTPPAMVSESGELVQTPSAVKEGWGWFGIGKKDKDKEKDKDKGVKLSGTDEKPTVR